MEPRNHRITIIPAQNDHWYWMLEDMTLAGDRKLHAGFADTVEDAETDARAASDAVWKYKQQTKVINL